MENKKEIKLPHPYISGKVAEFNIPHGFGQSTKFPRNGAVHFVFNSAEKIAECGEAAPLFFFCSSHTIAITIAAEWALAVNPRTIERKKKRKNTSIN